MPAKAGELNIAEGGMNASVWIRKFVVLVPPYLIVYDSSSDGVERDIISLTGAELAYTEALDPVPMVRAARSGSRAAIGLPQALTIPRPLCQLTIGRAAAARNRTSF